MSGLFILKKSQKRRRPFAAAAIILQKSLSRTFKQVYFKSVSINFNRLVP
jgi:hypothetical protein